MIHPLFLDLQPEYMQGCQEPMSLLLGPAGKQRLIALLQETLGACPKAPVVLPQFTTTDEYVAAISEHCSGARVVPFAQFDQTDYDASDWLLFIDPRFYCDAAVRMPAMLRDGARLRARAAHLVAMARHEGGINERIEFAADGRVRKIQRYYDSATWPQLTGVACSLTSVACFRTSQQPLVFESLEDLRRQLADRGVPSRDVPIEGGVFDLRKPGELLRLNERLLASPHADPNVHTAASGNIHPTARLIGPIVVHDRARVEEGATVVGPAVIGTGARVRAYSVVAQSIIGDGLTIPAGSVLRHRAVFSDDSLEAHAAPEIESAGDEVSAPEFDIVRGPHRPLYARAKVMLDRTIAAVALILLSPFLAIIAALIKLDSRGGVFFRDSREGCNGELFQCWKFRTMHVGSDLRQRELFARNDVDGPQFKLERDPRLTRVGRWLRPMSFDELPQLFNVLRGEMSLIGPRPSPFRENQQCVPWRDARLSVRPGITGLWQVCRFDRPGGDFHQWIYFDLLYVQQMSFWLDLKILLATILSRGGQKNVRIDRLIQVPRLRP